LPCFKQASKLSPFFFDSILYRNHVKGCHESRTHSRQPPRLSARAQSRGSEPPDHTATREA
jgi:hypothetical protein